MVWLLFEKHVSFALARWYFKRKRMRLCLFMHVTNVCVQEKYAHARHWKLACRILICILFCFIFIFKSKMRQLSRLNNLFIALSVIQSVNLIHIFIICIALLINYVRIA